MSENVAVFQTYETLVTTRILRNLEISNGKWRSYFDVMKNVDTRRPKDADQVLNEMIARGEIVTKPRVLFPSNNRAPVTVTMYKSGLQIPVLSERV